MKAGIYCRVSTDVQEREGTSLQTQLEQCLEYCKDRGYEVAHQFSEAFSGLSLERPHLDRLREVVRGRGIDVLVCYSIDRLSRSPTHGVIITEELEKHNVALEAVTEPTDGSDIGKLITYIRGFASKLEAEKIRERTMRGKKARALSGKMPGSSHARLYGYTYIPGKGIGEGVRYIKEEEAAVVRMMYDWLLEGASTSAITFRLRDLGIPTPGGGPYWIRSTVLKMLKNPAYCGKTYAFTRTYGEPKYRLKANSKRHLSGVIRKPKEEWIEIPNATPAIISEDIYNAAQERLEHNRKMSLRNSKHQYLLHGHIYCAKCGRAYWAAPGIKTRGEKRYEYPYYYCSARMRAVTPVKCHNKQHSAKRIEAEIWAAVERVLSEPDTVFAELEKMHSQEHMNDWQGELERVACLLTNRQKQKDRINKAFHITGDEATFRRDIEAISKEIEGLERERERLEKRLEASNSAWLDATRLRDACDMVMSRLKGLSFEDKRLALDALGIRVIVDGESLTLQGIIPISVGSIGATKPSSVLQMAITY